MSANEALAYVEKSIDNVEGLDITWLNDEVLEMLQDLRRLLVKEREDALHDALAMDVASALYQASIAHLRRQLESARRWAVQLEQEQAEQELADQEVSL